MDSRAYSQPSSDAHHWALRRFTAWADARGIHNPAAWEAFLANYDKKHRPTLGPLRPNVFTAVRNFLRCGDLASGFTRLQCPDCGHERLLAFTCKGRHFCPSCHHSSLPNRKLRMAGHWKAHGSEECPS